jgi:ElaB/YqjD/DUF883 family membrane-anchored ribosome-binding protein
MQNGVGGLELERSRLARERVFADLRALTTDAEELLKATASDVSEKSKVARQRLSAAIERARESCNEAQLEAVANAKAAARKANETVRAHPYEAIGVAVVVGILVGALLNRK